MYKLLLPKSCELKRKKENNKVWSSARLVHTLCSVGAVVLDDADDFLIGDDDDRDFVDDDDED